MSKKHEVITNIRGRGTLIGWDMPSKEARDVTIQTAMKKGLLLGACGHRAIRLRPSLMFSKRHADEFLQIFENVILTETLS